MNGSIIQIVQNVLKMRESTEARRWAARWWAEQLQRDKETRRRFAKALEPRLRMYMDVSTDYDPDQTLLSSLHDAGVECKGFMFSCDGILPRKTWMKIEREKVMVKEGYGALFHTIFPHAE